MPKFVFRAKTRDGQPCQDFLRATTLGQARYILEIRGYRDIEFFSDDNADDVRRAVLSGTGVLEEELPEWDAAEEIASQRRQGALAKLWWAFKQHFAIFGLLLLWNWFSWRGERPFTWLDWVGFALAVTYLVLFLLMVLPMIVFNQLLEASAWCDWKRARRWTSVARFLRKLTRTGIPEMELQIREAYALAAEGRLAEALVQMEKVRGNPGLTESMYLGRLSTVYEYARQYEQMIGCLEKAAEKNPGGVGEWIDLATARIRRQCDVQRAEAALEKVEGREMSVLAGAALARCRAMVACEAGRYVEARDLLEKALAGMAEHAGNPLLQGWVAEAKAYLALALAGLGEKDAARENLKAATQILSAGGEDALLRRCRAAVA